MQTLEVSEKDTLVEVPSDWDEMTPKQFKYVLQQAVLLTSGRIDLEAFRIRCFYSLANIKRDWKTLIWERFSPAHLVEEKNENITLLSKRFTKFLFKPNKKNKKQMEFNFDTPLNHLPVIRFFPFKKFHGPADILADLTFGEFRSAIEEMNNFFNDKEPHSLNRMIACLYRPAGADPEQNSGRVREPFNRERVERHARKIRKIQPWQSLAILSWFTWCIHYLQREDLIIGGKEINLSPLFPKSDEDSAKVSSPGIGWTGVLFGIAREGLFGNIEQTEKANLFDVLLFMYDNHLQAEKAKRNSKIK